MCGEVTDYEVNITIIGADPVGLARPLVLSPGKEEKFGTIPVKAIWSVPIPMPLMGERVKCPRSASKALDCKCRYISIVNIDHEKRWLLFAISGDQRTPMSNFLRKRGRWILTAVTLVSLLVGFLGILIESPSSDVSRFIHGTSIIPPAGDTADRFNPAGVGLALLFLFLALFRNGTRSNNTIRPLALMSALTIFVGAFQLVADHSLGAPIGTTLFLGCSLVNVGIVIQKCRRSILNVFPLGVLASFSLLALFYLLESWVQIGSILGAASVGTWQWVAWQPAAIGLVMHILNQDFSDTQNCNGVQSVLSDQVIFERTAATILEDFVHCAAEDFDENMSQVLARLGSYIGANRCYLYGATDGFEYVKRVVFWDRSDGEKRFSPPASISWQDMSWLQDYFRRDPLLVVKDVADLPESAVAFRTNWMAADTTAFGAVRIMQKGQTRGFLGIEAPTETNWGTNEGSLLRLVADLFSTMLSKIDAERCLIEAMETVQANSKAKSGFLAKMSHEIRTPMNGVLGLTELLMDSEMTPYQRHHLELIYKSGDSLLTLINQILDISKIEAGHVQLDLVKTDLRSLAEEIISIVAVNYQTKDLDILCRVVSGVPDKILVDPTRLRQVLINLLNNAAKFTKEGYIELKIECLGIKDGCADLRFEVTDTGIGIAPAKMIKIFEEFSQAEASTTREFGGTGLGLAISQQLVKLMSGRIDVTSIENEGSTFSFKIPVHSFGVLPSKPVPVDRSMVILSLKGPASDIVEEHAAGLGYRCCRVDTWEAAVQEVIASPAGSYEFLLVDPRVLPEDDPWKGEEFARLAPATKPKIVLLTNWQDVGHYNDLEKHSIFSTLTQPVLPTCLAVALAGSPRQGEPSSTDTPVSAQDCTSANARRSLQRDRQPRILLVEDNLVNQKVAIGLMAAIGCHVHVAGNGYEALKEIKNRQQYDLVFMDCQMPEMDGYEATRRIRKLPGPIAQIPIIAMTASALTENQEACSMAGMDDFVSKPINKATLYEMIEKWQAVQNG